MTRSSYIGSDRLVVELPIDIKIKFQEKCNTEGSNLSEKTRELVERYIKHGDGKTKVIRRTKA